MDLIYSMRRKPLNCEPPHFESVTDHEVVRPICTISTCNIIAFSSPTELNDTEGDTWGGHVYVCDLDTPWDSHRVTGSAYPISVLEWDIEGKQLLVANTVGEVLVFTQKDYLLNEWTCIYTASFPGEHIIGASFFHNGRRTVMVDKKPDAPISERIQMLRCAPTLKGFGGVASEGACIVTATGLVGALTPPAEGTRATVTTDCLRPTRDHITAVSIAHKNGSLAVAMVCRGGGGGGGGAGGGARRWCVRVVCVGVAAAALRLEPLPTIYLPPQDAQPVSISWCGREECDSLLVAGAALSLWKCTERAHQVHKLFAKGPLQGSTTPGGGPKPGLDCFSTLAWQKTAAWGVEGGERGVCAASSRHPGAPPHAVLATPRAIHLLARDTHHYICSRAVVTTGGLSAVEAASTPPKKTKYGPNGAPGGAGCAIVSCVEMSHLGGVLVAVDTHAQLHVYRLPQPAADIPTPLAVQLATGVLEWALVAGRDPLDVLLAAAPSHNVLELLYERITESFQRQPPAFQQYYYHNWLKLRIALCRMIPGAQSSASWLTCLQALQAGWAAVSLALRPDDKPDAGVLGALLDDHAHDHEKSLLALESKPEAVVDAAALQPLRRCIQRALDIGLTALLALAAPHHHHTYEVVSDGAAVSLLRRLAGLARAARPAARAADLLARPLARLASAPPPPVPPKQDLVEECALLGTQWTGARVWESLPRCAVSAPHGKQWPLYLEYGVEPEALRYNPDPPVYAQCETTPSITMDAIRYMYVGGGLRPARWRQCGRCGSRALAASQPNKHPLQSAYDGRFLADCRCGGKWTLFSNI